MKYVQIRSPTKINKLLDLILDLKSRDPKTKLIKIYRVCKLTMNFYFNISETETIYFRIYNPSQFALNEINQLKKEKETEK